MKKFFTGLMTFAIATGAMAAGPIDNCSPCELKAFYHTQVPYLIDVIEGFGDSAFTDFVALSTGNYVAPTPEPTDTAAFASEVSRLIDLGLAGLRAEATEVSACMDCPWGWNECNGFSPGTCYLGVADCDDEWDDDIAAIYIACHGPPHYTRSQFCDAVYYAIQDRAACYNELQCGAFITWVDAQKDMAYKAAHEFLKAQANRSFAELGVDIRLD